MAFAFMDDNYTRDINTYCTTTIVLPTVSSMLTFAMLS